jgi:hypothetical protein
MKKLVVTALFAASVFAVRAQAIKTPAASTAQSVKQEFGLSSVELSYSRPNAKGRTIFGDLVPYNAVWRTGANSATTLTFSDEVMIGGKKVPAGKYGLLTIPNTASWTIILTRQTDVTSPAAYKQDQDVVRITATPQDMPFDTETFTMQFMNVKANSMDLLILWERTAVFLPISMDIDSKVMSQIENAMNKDNKPYFQAAMYYLDNGKDLNKANEWLDKAVQQTPNAYWVWHQKANCLARQGKKQEAIAAANKSIELAKAGKNNDYVALNEKLLSTLK